MMTPTNDDFDKLETELAEIVFDLIIAGRASSKTKVTGLRWFIEQDAPPGWLVSIYGLGHSAPMELDFIAARLQERDYDVTNIEIILESEE